MTEQESLFLDLIGEYLFDKPVSGAIIGSEAELLRLSVSQNMFGICWAALKRRNGSRDTLEKSKRIVVAAAVSQTRKTERFLRFYRALSQAGISAICVKGLTIRTLYPEPDLRPSSDEDLIIDENERQLFFDVCQKSGFKIKNENKNQITVHDEQSGLLVEAQTEFFLPSDRIGEKMNGFFSESRKQRRIVDIQGVEIRTLGFTDNLLYLICHVLKHYIRSGFGIRQICDILLFCRKHSSEIDFDRVFGKLCEISAEGFAADIFKIGQEYFGLKDFVAEPFDGIDVAFETLLEDVLSAGVFGKSTAERTHSAALTLAAVKGEKNVGKSAVKRAFVSFDELKSVYPGMKDRKWLYPYYSVLRLLSYFRGSNGVKSTGQSIQIATNRIEQFKAYGLIPGGANRGFDDVVIEAVKSRLECGQTAVLKVTGSSMTPFLVPERDSVELAGIKNEPKTGDVVLYKRKNGAYVLHRVIKTDKDGFYFTGDSQTFVEGPIEKDQLIAVCDAFVRKGKRIAGKEPRWKAYEFLWRKFRKCRPSLMKAYEKMKK
ncbi:MAG: nucleotidyltransferase family protein [Oscillospiraceae bacterium]|nr:nucleotidyltransferase family protein [Oscillospiraceae bacterium]